MILQARKQDAHRCIELLNLAMEHIAFVISGTNERERSDEILRSFFELEVCRLSYKNIYMYVQDSQILGAMCVYYGGDLTDLDAPMIANLSARGLAPNLDTECFDDEFYIDSIAVDERFRSQGIATKLISHAQAIAKERKFSKLALIVDTKKPQTRAFYERLGFKFDTNVIVNSHKYDHMIKEII